MKHNGVLIHEERVTVVAKQWMIAGIVCLFCFSIDRIGWLRWLRGGFERGLILIDQQMLLLTSVAKRPVQWFWSVKDQQLRLANLEDRLAKASIDQAQLHELQGKVQSLEALALINQPNRPAERLVKLIDYGDRLVIGEGEINGLVVGRIVTDKNGVLIGKIKQVGRYMSDVEVIADDGNKIPVQTTSGTAKGIVIGRGKTVELTGVLQAEPLTVGDVVVTSGVDGNYPPGLVVGQVVSLTGKPEDVIKGALISPLAQRNEWVAVW